MRSKITDMTITITKPATATRKTTGIDLTSNLRQAAITATSSNSQVRVGNMVRSAHRQRETIFNTGSPEMTNMNGAQGRGPDYILNECRGVDRAIDEIEKELQRLEGVQQRYLADTNTSRESPLGREVDRLSQNIMTEYRGLVGRVKNIKQNPESGNPRNAPQVGKIDRRLKTTITRSQQLERDFRRKAQEQIERQYRIVRPDASDAEVREAVEDTSNQQVFSQAVCNHPGLYSGSADNNA
jgi:t-SNARE complex subunit (syntaxin)